MIPATICVGSIPGSIGNLTGLVTLDLASNELSGSIPTNIGRLKKLTRARPFGEPADRGHPQPDWRPDQSLRRARPAQQPLTGGTAHQPDQPKRRSDPRSGVEQPLRIDRSSGGDALTASDRSAGEQLRRGGARCDRQSQFPQPSRPLGEQFHRVRGGIRARADARTTSISPRTIWAGSATSFSQIATLTELDLSLNLMTGPIPDGIINLGLLSSLDISNNQLNDTEIPLFRIRGAGSGGVAPVQQHLSADQ